MHYILEAHPDLTHDYDPGVHFLGDESKVQWLNHYLLATALGGLAKDTNTPMLNGALEHLTSDKVVRGMPRWLAPAVELMLRNADDYLDQRGDVIRRRAVAGNLTTAQLLQEATMLAGIRAAEEPQLLTYDGLLANYKDGRFVPDVTTANDKTLDPHQLGVASEVGADSFTFMVAVSGNEPKYGARPRMASPNHHLVLGRVGVDGDFDQLVTVLSSQDYGQNFPPESP